MHKTVWHSESAEPLPSMLIINQLQWVACMHIVISCGRLISRRDNWLRIKKGNFTVSSNSQYLSSALLPNGIPIPRAICWCVSFVLDPIFRFNKIDTFCFLPWFNVFTLALGLTVFACGFSRFTNFLVHGYQYSPVQKQRCHASVKLQVLVFSLNSKIRCNRQTDHRLPRS